MGRGHGSGLATSRVAGRGASRGRSGALVLVAAVAAVALLLVAATHGGNEPQLVVIAVGSEPGTLNWLVTTGGSNTERAWVRPAFDPLAERDEEGLLQPVLLRRVPSRTNGGMRVRADGGLVMVLDIRPDAAWSDGTPITCADVTFTWQTIASDRWPTSPRGGWDRVQSIDCPTPRRAVVRFAEAGAFVELLLTAMPLPAHHLSGGDFRRAMRDRIDVRSGPYRLVHWQRGVGLAYEADPAYWRSNAHDVPERLELRATSGSGGADLLVTTGRVDVAIRPLNGTIEDEQRTFGDRLHLLPPQTVVTLAFNHGRSPTGELAVRRAVLAAIDRRQVARAGLGRDGEVASSLTAGSALPDDPWVAASATGAPSGAASVDRPLVLVAPAGRAPMERAAQVLHSQLEAADIPVVLRIQAPELYYGQTMPKGTWDLMLVEVAATPEYGVRPTVACEPTQGRNNFMRFCDREVDRLQERWDAELDPDERDRLDAPLQRLLAQHVAAIPLFEPRAGWISGGRIDGIGPTSDGHLVSRFDRWRVRG